MSEEARVLPEPEMYAVCAIDDASIKEYYRGYFDEVFIFFHPFIKPISIDISVFKPSTYPDKIRIVKHCEPVSWSEFLELSSISSFDELDIGLRTRILGLKQHLSNNNIANLIDATCDKFKLIEPTEGMLPQIIIDRILKAIQSIGYNWLWVGDEFCTERRLEYIDDIIYNDNLFRHNLFTPDKSILITTHWDSHFSLLCSTKETIEKIIGMANLEGFYCQEDTEIYWSVSKKN
ncbi:DUF2711 family protein [Paenibacillus segetis]|uniref:DUF2711 domain-containing protein n=1 Tax=Paenibacillus segetis TaxID=1325360 RepID=A0ABQ1YIR2_9BACL|nr:DUF2711 family protein [Paenibacillus segetis]GGH27763.1 hypothetical protein GCM10008013_29390 [Paenibacillus segetis]